MSAGHLWCARMLNCDGSTQGFADGPPAAPRPRGVCSEAASSPLSGGSRRDQPWSEVPNVTPTPAGRAQLSFPQRTPVTVHSVTRKGPASDWGAAETPQPKKARAAHEYSSDDQPAMSRCGNVAAEKHVIAEGVSLAEAALRTVEAGIQSCPHAANARVTNRK